MHCPSCGQENRERSVELGRRMEQGREVELKGLTGRQRVYEVAWE